MNELQLAPTLIGSLLIASLAMSACKQTQPAGPNTRCLRGVCAGMPITAAFAPSALDSRYGRIILVYCGYEDGFRTIENSAVPAADFARHGCPSVRYMISFSDERLLTNFWVDSGKIARIDEYRRHVLDF